MQLVALLLSAAVCATHAAPATVNWVSDPLRPGGIGLIAGGGFTAASKVTLTDSAGKATVAAAPHSIIYSPNLPACAYRFDKT